MKSLKTAMTPFASILLLIILAAPASATTQGVADQRAISNQGKVVALVNQQPIYAAQLTPLVEKNLRHYRRKGTLSANVSEEMLRGLQQKALQKVVATELIYQEASKLEILDLEAKIAEAASQRADQQTNEIRREIIITEYLQQNGLLNPQVSEDAIKAYYDSNKQALASVTDDAWVRHIMIKAAKDAPEEVRSRAKEKIEKARQLVVAGAPFDEVAKKYSEDFVAEQGGYIGKVYRGFMPAEFDRVAFSIELNRLSDVIQTQYGYHVLEVIARAPKGTIPPYEKTKEFIGKYLQPEHANRVLTEHIKALGKQAKIENLLE